LTHEEAFAVYEPFCANFNEASKLILSEAPKLQVRSLLRLSFFYIFFFCTFISLFLQLNLVVVTRAPG
jgi:hypothetical protein